MMYVFDVDGTLTPSRREINNLFKWWFQENIQNYCFVTGSDRDKTIEQVGLDMFVGAKYSFNCNGNDVNFYGAQVHTNDWTLPEDARDWLNTKLEQSKFVLRTGNHIEERPGMVNFSIVGRNANIEERAKYVAYDTFENERNTVASSFNTLFPDLSAKVGGETGIDISPKGADKSQIVKDFNKQDTLWFFGDAIYEGGNDYPLAKVVKNHRKVTGWAQTKEYLEVFQDNGKAV